MRIVSLEEFRALPEWTLYKKCVEPFAFEDWCIKGETWDTDFVCCTLDGLDANDSGQYFDMLDQMWNDSAISHQLHIEANFGRDGMFEREAKFMVMEEADLLMLSTIAGNCLKALKV